MLSSNLCPKKDRVVAPCDAPKSGLSFRRIGTASPGSYVRLRLGSTVHVRLKSELEMGMLHAMGLPSPFFLGWLTIVIELVGGLMILVGALIPLATLPMMIVLFVAIITVHLPNGFSSIKLQSFDAAGAHFGQPGYETDLLYLASLLALCFGGPGPVSVDGWLNRLVGKHRVVGGKSSEVNSA